MPKFSYHVFIDYIFITIGAFIASLGVGVFLIDAKVVPGGVSGVSFAIHYISGAKIPVGICMWIINIPLFIWGVKKLGRSFGFRTFWGFTANSFFIDFLRGEYIEGVKLQNLASVKYLLEHDFLFLVLIASLLLGLGLGIVFKFKGSTAGSDIVAAIANKYWHIKPGIMIIIVDFFVIIFAAIIIQAKGLSLDKPSLVLFFYSFLLLITSSVLVDMVIFGFDYARAAFIISDKKEEILKRIIFDLDKGATVINSEGAFTHKKQDMIYTVVRKKQIHKLTEIVRELDPSAFMIVSNVYEVLGAGFDNRLDISSEYINILKKLFIVKKQVKKTSFHN